MNSPEVDQLLDPNYSEYAPVPKKVNWKNLNHRWAEENKAKVFISSQRPVVSRGCMTSAVLGGAATLGLIYFVGWWVVPFAKALWAAR